MSDTPTVELRRADNVATLALNRPEKYNAVNMQMHRELAAALATIRRDADIRALVITGNGKAFCAGQDLTEFGSHGPDFRVDDHVRATFNRFVMGLRELPIPVIAAVNGVAAGAGASLALAADLRICSDRASFMQAFVRIGLVPDTGSTWLLPHLIGIERALELAFTGAPVDAARAVELGMATRVVEHEHLTDEVQEFATALASQPTQALGLTKRAMYRSLTCTFDDALEYEAQMQQYAAHTTDHREGVQAFLEKREPVFVGR
jgi:2-(1,2-epoxy-1,2-dihydrophenyl)acetyl-CoA isomerase